jgi:preprotein translocase subunit YajC
MTTTLSTLAQQQGGLLGSPMIMIILMIVMFYFVLIRPQKKLRKEKEALIAALKKGDKVVTIGGMHGMVHQVSEETVTIKISEGILVPFNKVAIDHVKPSKTERYPNEKAPEEAPKS